MKKISGRITNIPLPLSKDGIYTMQVRIGTPIEGVKITDGEKVAFSDKNGLYEIETNKNFIEFSKGDYASEIVNTSSFADNSTTKKDIVLQLYGVNKSVEEKKIMGFNQSTFFIALGGIILLGVGLMVIIPKLKNK